MTDRFRKQLPLSFLWGDSERLARQSAALVTLARRHFNDASAFDSELQVLTEMAANTLHVERVGVWFYDASGMMLENADLYERSKKRHSRDRSIRSIDFPQYFRAIEQERALVADDAHADPRTSEYLDEYLLPKGIKSLLDAPIRARGKVIGVICIESVGRKRRWTIDEQNFASSLADIVATHFESVERLRAQEELQYRVEYERLILSIANRFINVRVQDVPIVVNDALRTVGEFLRVDRCYAYQFDSDGLTISNTNEWCNTGIDHKIRERQRIPVSAFPWGIARVKRGESVRVNAIEDLPDSADRTNWRYFHVKSLVWVPLLRDGKVYGFIGCTCTTQHMAWSDESLGLLRLVGETLTNMYARVEETREREAALLERQELEKRMQQTQKLESLGLLAGGVAHDFNNLLMGMLGNTGLLLLELPKDSKARERLEQIQRAAERAAELTSQLLAYSGKGRLLVEPVDVAPLASEMLELLRPMLPARAKVHLDFGAGVPRVDGDATQIRQVLMNLITNACDSLENRTGDVYVRTFSRCYSSEELRGFHLAEDLPAGDYVVVQVQDSGCGMSLETLNRIFDPFFTTKFTGRGLGLAAVHGIIRGHRGAIRVDSELDRGTTFTVLFPASTKVISPKAIVVRDHETFPSVGTVLVVDDEKPSREVVVEILKQFGCQVLSAESGERALEVLREHRGVIALVLLDLTMPGMDGEETFVGIRRIEPELPIVVMSGYSESQAPQRIRHEPLSGFLQKPFSPKTLKECIDPFLTPKSEPKLRLVK